MLRRTRAAHLALVPLAAGALAGCGATTAVVAPAAHSAAERTWLDNAGRFIGTLDSDVLLSANGGANLATARRALHDESDVYSMLVAYTLFGDCGPALANVGTPGVREEPVVRTLVAACGRLEHASALFQQAMTRHDAHALLTATRVAADTTPILDRAREQLGALGSG